VTAAEATIVAARDADRRVLEFASVNRLVSGAQAARLLDLAVEAASERLSRLAGNGSLARGLLGLGEAPWFRITPAGLRAVGSRLAAPGFGPWCRHALGVGWLWLLASEGTFGPVEQVLTEREMKSVDKHDGVEAPFAARPEEFGGAAAPHYPDLMLLTTQGRIAVELLLDAPARGALEAVLRAYAADVRISTVLYLATGPWVGRLVQSVAAELELSAMVRVQPAKVPLG
jgi:hypothetical protein